MQRSLLLFPLCALGVACGNEPSPVLVGSIGPALRAQMLTSAAAEADERPSTSRHGDFELSINGDFRQVPLEDDGVSFSVQELPTGELTIEVAIEDITGTLELTEVKPGEVIEVDVGTGPGQLSLSVIRREKADPDDYGMVPPNDDERTLHIRGNHVVHHLEAGTYVSDVVIDGDHVTLVGADWYGCHDGGRSHIEGDLVVNGNHVRIVNVNVLGHTEINGDHVKVYRGCKKPKK